MKLHNIKKVLFITLLVFTSSVQLQAMSLQKLMVIMFVCSPGTQTVAKQYIRTIKTRNGFRIFDHYVRFPESNILEYPSKIAAGARNKNRF